MASSKCKKVYSRIRSNGWWARREHGETLQGCDRAGRKRRVYRHRPALPGVVEQGDTADEAFENMGRAIRFTLDSMIEEGEDLPPSDAPRSLEVRDIEMAI